ncbi:MAG: family 10 glycosylhydrolase [Candidatus Marinimicrobia bacterium]|nr:family 10 glycosylhydrolase [Candidatus Neomarinimicrobiota bacterium]
MRKFRSTVMALITLSALLFASDNEEFRGTWVITWEHLSDSTVIREILDNHVAANMNAVLYQVRQGGTAYYRSSFEPWGPYADYTDPGYDPLEFVIEEAHKRGLEVHAWFNTFQTSSTAAGTPAGDHPEWVCRDGNDQPMPAHRALSPALPEVRDYTLDVIMEIVNNYDIDGLHLDYVRWNEYTTSSVLSKSVPEERMLDGQISPVQLALLETTASSNRYLYDYQHKYADGVPAGYATWEDFWRSSVTEMVMSIHDSIQLIKPHVRLSVAALGKYRWSGWQGYESVYQDAALWYNEGYIDQLMPMHYHWTNGAGFYSMLVGAGTENWGYWLNDDSEVLFSVGPGSYLLEGSLWKNHAQIVNEARRVDYVDGFQFFSYGSWEGHLYFEEAGHTFFSNKTKIRENGLYDGNAPESPAISLEKENPMKYNIVVTPNSSEKLWYAVYRSEDESIDVDTDEIIAVQMAGDIFTITDEFDGNQNFNGQYTYAVTALNRFWKESGLSNIQTSDSILVNPPVILSLTPTVGDSITTTPVITFEFSKEMDLASFQNSFSVVPEVTIKSFTISNQWYNENKEISVALSGLDFGTEYTLTIGIGTTDLSGMAIDGNYDGTGGDAYSAVFYTYEVDIQGPTVSATSVTEEIVDPEEPFTFCFDELIDSESLMNNIILANGENEILPDYSVKDLDNMTILTVKTKSALRSGTALEITLSTGILDTVGNAMEEAFHVATNTAGYYYSEINLMDNFMGATSWWDPEGSGSTVGTIDGFTKFSHDENNYLPGFTNKKSGKITYMWDESYDGQPLLRDHAASGPGVTAQVDTSYTLQCYVFGDGSNNLFRFAMYEKNGSDVAEVSLWTTIDWIGWKLVEWDMGDASQIGEWLGNGIMDGAYYQLDGLHMSRGEGGAISGEIYVDELRFVKKALGEQPVNHAPVIEEFEDYVVEIGSNLKLKVNYTDEDPNDSHEIICLSDTSAVLFNIKGHTPGSTVYIVPNAEFEGETEITIIVKDFGIGELSDTTTFIVEFSSDVAIHLNIIPEIFNLSQNYPNPFNSSTNIEFSIPFRNRVMVNIYDMRGALVKQLVKGWYEPGKYTVTFNASGLASGAYIYQMHAGKKIFTKKMMLLK